MYTYIYIYIYIYRIFTLDGTADIILVLSVEGKGRFVKIEVTIRLLARKNGRADAKSSNKNRSTRTIVPGQSASLFFHFAKRTNQAEGCYQNFRLRDKLNYGGNSGIGGHTAENCDGDKKLRDRKVKNGPRCKSVAATRKSVIAREEKRAQLGGGRGEGEGREVHYTRDFSAIARYKTPTA